MNWINSRGAQRPRFFLPPFGGAFTNPFASSGARAFAPTDIAGLQLWLKADVGAGVNDNDAVGTWTDQSGNGNNATQATADNKPTYKTNIQSGLPVVRFDGSNDFLGAARAASAALTVFMVMQKRSAPVAASQYAANLIAWGTNAYASIFAHSGVSATGICWYDETGGSKVLGGTVTNWQVLTLKFASAASVTPYINGTAGTAIDPGDAYATAIGLTLGSAHNGSANGDFDIGEMLIYNAALSDANRTKVETYLNTRWAIY